jgi:hypothetical protein
MLINNMKGEQHENYFDFSDDLSQLCVLCLYCGIHYAHCYLFMFRNVESFEL